MGANYQAILADHIREKIAPFPETGCWLWTGSHDKDGYGRAYFQKKMKMAHRVCYEFFIGPIPKDKELDHVCRVRCCVNPSHLEPVTHAENMRRSDINTQRVVRSNKERAKARTHCPQGHPYSGANLYIPAGGERRCRICNKHAQQRRRKKLGESK